MIRRLAALAFLLVLAGCATAPRGGPGETPSTAPVVPGSRYEAETGRDPATIAQMRAAPAPASPELEPGKTQAGDHGRQTARGYVHIGTGYFPDTRGDAQSIRDEAIRQGQAVGADRVLLYAPTADAPTRDWIATYYVHFQLPFGATFRDLGSEERATLGADGGVALGSVINGTPASRANLMAGDIVLKCDGKPIADRAGFQTLLKARAGRSVTLTIVRNGETLQRIVRLGVMAGNARE